MAHTNFFLSRVTVSKGKYIPTVVFRKHTFCVKAHIFFSVDTANSRVGTGPPRPTRGTATMLHRQWQSLIFQNIKSHCDWSYYIF